jgi:hypothetical protein
MVHTALSHSFSQLKIHKDRSLINTTQLGSVTGCNPLIRV